jgi:hypothetical protein
MNRRDFIRRGSLWAIGTAIVTPEILDRLTWRRTMWTGAEFQTYSSNLVYSSFANLESIIRADLMAVWNGHCDREIPYGVGYTGPLTR